MGENYLHFGMENPEFYNLMFIMGEPMKVFSEMGCDWKPGDAAISVLKATVTECMEKGFIAKADPQLVSLAIWSFVHGLVSLALRGRMEKFVEQKELLMPVMKEAVNWLINNIEYTGKEN
jgi:hypothetical protein